VCRRVRPAAVCYPPPPYGGTWSTPAVWGHSAPRRNHRQANRQQVIADLFGIVDLVALAGLFNSLLMMRLPEPPAPDTLRETTLGLTSRRSNEDPRADHRCREDRLAGLEIRVFNGRGSSSVDA
jgi:hypothetical protein